MYATGPSHVRMLCFLGQRDKQHLEGAPLGARLLLDLADVLGVFYESRQDAFAPVFMDDLTPAEKHGHLAAVSVLKKTPDMPELGLVVMVVGFRPDLDFLDLDYGLVLLGFLLLLFLLVLEFSEIHDTADRRFSVRSDLHQVIALFLREIDGILAGQNAYLLPFRTDNPHFAGANLLVAARPVLGRVTARSDIRRGYSSSLHI